jgi:putative transcriptional regulator
MTFVVMIFTVDAAALNHASLMQLPRAQWPTKSNSLNQRRIGESAMMALPANRDGAMLRVRLKADGRLVEILPDGSERDIASDPRSIATAAHNAARVAAGRVDDAAYARNVRSRTGLTQTVFAARIGVPVETVRNWEQGKRSPRGPARALLKVLEEAPEAAFAVLAKAR